MKIILGENLKEFRKSLGLSQSGLANKINEAGIGEGISVAYKTISKWESGNGYPEIPMLVHLAKVLDTTIDFLLTGIDPKRELMRENEMLNSIKRNTDQHLTYYTQDGILHLRIFEPEKYLKIEFAFYRYNYITQKNEEIEKKDITNNITFNEILLIIPKTAEGFFLKLQPKESPQLITHTKNYKIVKSQE